MEVPKRAKELPKAAEQGSGGPQGGYTSGGLQRRFGKNNSESMKIMSLPEAWIMQDCWLRDHCKGGRAALGDGALETRMLGTSEETGKLPSGDTGGLELSLLCHGPQTQEALYQAQVHTQQNQLTSSFWLLSHYFFLLKTKPKTNPNKTKTQNKTTKDPSLKHSTKPSSPRCLGRTPLGPTASPLGMPRTTFSNDSCHILINLCH